MSMQQAIIKRQSDTFPGKDILIIGEILIMLDFFYCMNECSKVSCLISPLDFCFQVLSSQIWDMIKVIEYHRKIFL